VFVLSGRRRSLSILTCWLPDVGQTCDVKLSPNAKEVLFRDGQCTNNAKIIALSV
jgi:hypothetical protein